MSAEIRITFEGQVLALAEEGEEGAEGEAAEEESATNPILPTGWEIIWAGLFFAILYFAMRYALVPPLRRTMSERNEKIRESKAAADVVDTDMGAARADYESTLAAARDEANGFIEAARGRADEYKAELQSGADAEIAELRATADTEIETARSSAIDQLRGDVSQLAVGAASAVLGRNVDVGTNQAVIDQAIGGGSQ